MPNSFSHPTQSNKETNYPTNAFNYSRRDFSLLLKPVNEEEVLKRQMKSKSTTAPETNTSQPDSNENTSMSPQSNTTTSLSLATTASPTTSNSSQRSTPNSHSISFFSKNASSSGTKQNNKDDDGIEWDTFVDFNPNRLG